MLFYFQMITTCMYHAYVIELQNYQVGVVILVGSKGIVQIFQTYNTWMNI